MWSALILPRTGDLIKEGLARDASLPQGLHRAWAAALGAVKRGEKTQDVVGGEAVLK